MQAGGRLWKRVPSSSLPEQNHTPKWTEEGLSQNRRKLFFGGRKTDLFKAVIIIEL